MCALGGARNFFGGARLEPFGHGSHSGTLQKGSGADCCGGGRRTNFGAKTGFLPQGRKDEPSERPVSSRFNQLFSEKIRFGAVLRKLLSFIASAAPRANLRASRSHAFSGEEKAWGIAYTPLVPQECLVA